MNAYEQRRDEEINLAIEHAESCVALKLLQIELCVYSVALCSFVEPLNVENKAKSWHWAGMSRGVIRRQVTPLGAVQLLHLQQSWRDAHSALRSGQ